MSVGGGIKRLLASHADYVPKTAVLDLEHARNPAQVRLVLPNGGRIEVVARGRRRQPLGQFAVYLDGLMDPWLNDWTRAFLGPEQSECADEACRLDHVAPGSGRVWLMAPALPWSANSKGWKMVARKPVEVADGLTTRVQFDYRGTVVRGRVRRDSRSIRGGQIILHGGRYGFVAAWSGYLEDLRPPPPAAGPFWLEALTGEDGRFERIVAEPDHYAVSLRTSTEYNEAHYELGREVRIPDVEAWPVDITLPASGIRGLILDRETRQPVDARFCASPETPGTLRRADGSADAEGRFEFAMDPGRARIDARVGGYAAMRQVVPVKAGDVAAVTYDLSRGMTISGRVKEACGAPVAGARLIAIRVAEPDFHETALTAADGTFRFSDLAKGPHDVMARRHRASTSSRRTAVVVDEKLAFSRRDTTWPPAPPGSTWS